MCVAAFWSSYCSTAFIAVNCQQLYTVGLGAHIFSCWLGLCTKIDSRLNETHGQRSVDDTGYFVFHSQLWCRLGLISNSHIHMWIETWNDLPFLCRFTQESSVMCSCTCISPNSTWLATSRLDTTRTTCRGRRAVRKARRVSSRLFPIPRCMGNRRYAYAGFAFPATS